MGRPSKNKIKSINLLQSYPKSAITDALNIIGYDPLLAIIQIASDLEVDIKIRYDANKELLSYMMPKLKRVEHIKTDENAAAQREMLEKINIMIENYTKPF